MHFLSTVFLNSPIFSLMLTVFLFQMDPRGQRGQATVVRKTSSPTAFANRGPGASGTSSDSPTGANNNAVGFVAPLTSKASPQSDPVNVMQPSRSSSSSSSSFSTSNQSRTCFVSRIRVRPTQLMTGLVTTTDTESTFIATSQSARLDAEGRSVTPQPHTVDADTSSEIPDQLLPALLAAVSSGDSAACDDLRSSACDLFPTEMGDSRAQLDSPVLSLHGKVAVISDSKISSCPTVSSFIGCPSGVDEPSTTSPCVVTVEVENPVISPISVSVTSTPVASQKSNDRADTPPTGERYWTPDPPASPSNGNTMPAPAVNVSQAGNETPADCTVPIPSASVDSDHLLPISNVISPHHMPSIFTSCESMPLTEPRPRLESLNDVD
ncbi:hypothetical protein AHF37_01246 [Paragonimus kellicotti]|nr:hypothetical protein AHF37_01246 [Paragonimus kellicotti]